VAVGECGLDSTYYDAGSPKDLQVMVFKEHLEMAKKVNLPLVVHLRGEEDVAEEAHAIMKDTLGEAGKSIGIHMHCFNFSLKVAEMFLQDFPGMKFGLVPHFFKAEVATGLDLTNLLTETDAPYFVPGHLRSKYPLGLPGFAYHAAAQVALIRDIPVAWVLKANKQNVKELYAIDVDNPAALDAPKHSSNKEDSVTPKYNQTRKNGYKALPVASCEGPLKLERDRNKKMDEDRKKAYEEAVKKLPKPKRELLADSFKRVRATKLPSRN